MAEQNVFLGKTINRTPLRGSLDNLSSSEKATPVTVQFEGNREGLLDMNAPAASAWAKMIDYLQKNNRPVYAVTDAGSGIITNLWVPEAAQVWEIRDKDQETVVVTFHTSAAIHYLRRGHPDFKVMLEALQSAKEKNISVLVTAAGRSFEIIDVREMPASFGIVKDANPSPLPDIYTRTSPGNPVSPERAKELFDLMAAESCTPCASTHTCIPFRYPPDGCWVRAALMCFRMMELGEDPEKIWSYGQNLHARSDNVPECSVGWSFHVAATLMVEQETGPELMVFDPSLSDRPLSQDEWTLLQTDPELTLRFTSWKEYYRGSEMTDPETANNDMEKFRIELDKMCGDEGPSPYDCPV